MLPLTQLKEQKPLCRWPTPAGKQVGEAKVNVPTHWAQLLAVATGIPSNSHRNQPVHPQSHKKVKLLL